MLHRVIGRKFFAVFLLLMSSKVLTAVHAQSTQPGHATGLAEREPQKDSDHEEEQTDSAIGRNPFFEGNLKEFLARNITYPAEAIKKSIQGIVYVRFVINMDGSLSDIEVVKGIGYGCDEEAARVIRLTSGLWKPGSLFGKPVRVRVRQPISFILDK